MKKDIEWLKEEIYKMFPSHSEMYEHPDDITVLKVNLLNEVVNLIDQLDEPEVLSQEWIDEHEKREQVPGPFGNVYLQHVVPSRYLQNLLVPKQEDTARKVLDKAIETGKLTDYDKQYIVIEKPTIPQFVADYIEEMVGTSWGNITDLFGQAESTLGDWWQGEANFEKLARAWLDGYTVEEEPQYIIKTGYERYLSQLSLNYVNNPPVTTVHHSRELAIRFNDRELAQKVANLVNDGKVEELEK